jgi:hypothetical protein
MVDEDIASKSSFNIFTTRKNEIEVYLIDLVYKESDFWIMITLSILILMQLLLRRIH